MQSMHEEDIFHDEERFIYLLKLLQLFIKKK